MQGSAAEWALCWMAQIRKALQKLDVGADIGGVGDVGDVGGDGGVGGASPFSQSPHLVFFLHDEVVVHTPAALAPQVQQIIVDAATEAGRLLFGDFPVDFLLTVATVDSYADAK